MQQTPEKFELEISKPSQDFTEHLTPDNHRILFSGPFGSGKTYFLNKYFEPKKRSVIHLYPVNYSVASNQDIFELIKYDILFELLAKGIEMEKWDFSNAITLHNYLQKNAYILVKKFVSKFSDVGKNIASIADELLALIRDYKADHQAQQIDQEEDVIAYLESFTGKTGSITEEDMYTLLIQVLLQKLKTENGGEETVLIIDDLDRIDPEHIFRLLNVFSAHFDLRKNQNKFGFDKIILICDINNIRNIYHAKYGADVDFTGYIDKFYSKEVFVFDNKAVVEKSIEKILSSIIIEGSLKDYFRINVHDNQFHEEIAYILSGMVKVNSISIRSLAPSYGQRYNTQAYMIKIGDMYNDISNADISLILIFDFLKRILGDSKSLKNALNNVSKQDLRSLNSKYDDDHSYKMRRVVTVLEIDRIGYRDFKAKSQTEKETSFLHPSNFMFTYKVSTDPRMRIYQIVNFGIRHEDGDLKTRKLNYFQFLLEAFEILQKYGLYKD